ncbi:HNH endonuclease [Burkholderia ubonensis]|uniref:HNH endonuclease n=1 Tax=Burkholderia ubonensis TaxID=101571 RepID=UPI000A610F73|nr:HNH endonuclease [Burkholderia ubonensis]
MTEASVLTAERLRELLDYDPDSGLFTRRVVVCNGTKVGEIAGSLNDRGYVCISVDGRTYKAHRLAFLWMTGSFPVYEVDHEDLNRSNNRWKNLRSATHSQNISNAKKYSTNTSGEKGVESWHGRGGQWRAVIRINGKRKHLGYFDDFELAVEFRRLAADMIFGDFARHE